jgi:hypothetical protein
MKPLNVNIPNVILILFDVLNGIKCKLFAKPLINQKLMLANISHQHVLNRAYTKSNAFEK